MKQKPFYKQIASAYLGIFFPPKCPCCGDVLAPGYAYCDVCEPQLPRIEGEICLVCGAGKKVCDCGKKAKLYDACVAAFYHTDGIRQGLLRFKYEERLSAADVFAAEMANTVRERLADTGFDFVTFVPMSKKEYKSRGYYPARILAQKVAEELELPCETLLTKIVETPPQRTLRIRERQGNVLGVFDALEPALIYNKTVLLCDDVSTTGATLNECAKMLKIAGAKAVYAVCIAKTALESKLDNAKTEIDQILDEEQP